jgi:hypothetical protein
LRSFFKKWLCSPQELTLLAPDALSEYSSAMYKFHSTKKSRSDVTSVGKIDGHFPVNFRMVFDLGQIREGFPVMSKKKARFNVLSGNRRKFSPYLTHFSCNLHIKRNFSAYLVCCSDIKDPHSFLGVYFLLENVFLLFFQKVRVDKTGSFAPTIQEEPYFYNIQKTLRFYPSVFCT